MLYGSWRCRPLPILGASTLPPRSIRIHQLKQDERHSSWQRIVQSTRCSSHHVQRTSTNPTGHQHVQKYYVLPMFAYPSGSLHMGHLRVYTISDVIARYRRMKGYNVLHPTGWDAFGLPAENAAIERGVDPVVWTEENIRNMKDQLKSMNTDFDWDAEISTCSPSFYKHTQKLFLMLYNRGLAYQAEALVNYDPVDKTVLANEQVDNDGRSWRSGALVQQVKLRQWFFRITMFKESLLKDLDFLSQQGRWPERVITQQRNWLGRSKGARLRFDIAAANTNNPVHVFTTRPDTLFGVKYLALSLTHPLVLEHARSNPQLQSFIDKKASFSPDSKAGFELSVQAVSPLSPDQKPLPVFAAPYVLEGYGDGAVMGVPGHDSRDLAFWKEHRPDDTIPMVVNPTASNNNQFVMPKDLEEAFTGEGFLSKACEQYAGMPSKEAGVRIVSDLSKSGKAEVLETWRLRDWLVSRQRYWGTPIPVIHCQKCGTVPVPEEDLPVVLPKLESSVQGGSGNPLEKLADWVNCECPWCHGPSKRETDTMDTFVDSSWYFARFADARNDHDLFSRDSADLMLPVDTYVGGVEHAILHLLYARFIYKFLCSEGLIVNANADREPFQQLIAQGMVHGKTFSDPKTGRFLLPHEIDHAGSGPRIKSTGETPNVSFEKMSKSKHNGVDPSACIKKYGADATRAHVLFSAPVSEVMQWDEEKIVGIQRWFGRLRRSVSDHVEANGQGLAQSRTFDKQDMQNVSKEDSNILLHTQSTIRRVTHTIDHDVYSLNTSVSDLIKLTNALIDVGTTRLTPTVLSQVLSVLLRMLMPIAPAFSLECLKTMFSNLEVESNRVPSWPEAILTPAAEDLLKSLQGTMNCAVQINGKLRFNAQIPAKQSDGTGSTSQQRVDEITATILETEEGKRWLTEKNDWTKKKRVVLVGDGKLLNIVF